MFSSFVFYLFLFNYFSLIFLQRYDFFLNKLLFIRLAMLLKNIKGTTFLFIPLIIKHLTLHSPTVYLLFFPIFY